MLFQYTLSEGRAMTRFASVTESGLDALVARFYERVRQDAALGPVFEAAVVDWDEHRAQLGRFWSSVMLASGRFKGDPMGVHRRLPIRAEMFPRWLGLWETTVDELFAPAPAERLKAAARRIGTSLELGLFFRPETLQPA
jgi:hemoglobin